jgi:hypothetical protein
MKDFKYFIFVIFFAIISISLAIIASNNTYGRVELRRFNKLNNTSYTLEEWDIYEYDIKKLHPYSEIYDK